MERKYRTVSEGIMLRIIALKDFSDVEKGDRGGLISSESNLSQEGDCWIYPNAMVGGNAVISGNARIYGHAIVEGNAKVHDNAQIFGSAMVYGNTEVCGNAIVCGTSEVGDFPKLYGNAQIFENVSDNTWVENVCAGGKARISGNVKIWATMKSLIDASTEIKNNSDYIIFAVERGFYVVTLSSYIGSLVAEDIYYVKNIQTIRQLYGKEV